MSKKELLLWLVLADFAAFTAWTVYSEGLFTFLPVAVGFASGSAWGAQIVFDFLLALAVATGWVIADARSRGLAWWPFAALTLCLGSMGPLAYLIYRERAGASVPSEVRRVAHA